MPFVNTPQYDPTTEVTMYAANTDNLEVTEVHCCLAYSKRFGEQQWYCKEWDILILPDYDEVYRDKLKAIEYLQEYVEEQLQSKTEEIKELQHVAKKLSTEYFNWMMR